MECSRLFNLFFVKKFQLDIKVNQTNILIRIVLDLFYGFIILNLINKKLVKNNKFYYKFVLYNYCHIYNFKFFLY